MKELYNTLPQKTRPAIPADFNEDGRRKIGMPFLVLRTDGKFDCYRISERTSARKLKKFIDDGRVWIFDD